jgi:glycosyltransferase involved in cell wall biosynthesis
MRNPKVSVIVSCYNYAHFLEEAVNSILNQTYSDFEVIICDDCSTDNTPEVVDRLRKKDSRVFSIRMQNNVGRAEIRNMGMRVSSGEYIAFLDADDWWESEKLEKQVAVLDRESSVVVVATLQKKYEDGKITYVQNDRGIVTGDITEYLLFSEELHGMSLMFRKTAIGDGFRKEFVRGQDIYFLLELSTRGKMDVVKEPLYVYRQHEAQFPKQITAMERFNHSKKVRRQFLKNYPEFATKANLKKLAYFELIELAGYYRSESLYKSLIYCLRALVMKPFSARVYVGIVKVCLMAVGVKETSIANVLNRMAGKLKFESV